MKSDKKLKALSAKKATLAVKLLAAVMGQMDSVDLTEEYYSEGCYRKRRRTRVSVDLSGDLMKEIDDLVDAQPPVEITVKLSARDMVKVKQNTENSCMTEATKKSILGALKAKGV